MTASPLTSASLISLAQRTRQAARQLALSSAAQRDRALEAIACALEVAAPQILAANQADCESAVQDGLARSLYGRLKLDESKLRGIILGVRNVQRLADPIGQVQIHRELDTNLILKRVTCPLGVLGVIFESRPDAAVQIASLAVKSGNGVILKGGKEAVRSCEALVKAIRQGLRAAELDPDAVQLLTTRSETLELLKLDRYVDLIIPRGSNSFVRFVQENSTIPVLGHADGICHLYVDRSANLDQAVTIAVDAKAGYPSACNAIETLLVHEAIAPDFLPQVATALRQQAVELRGDDRASNIVAMQAATEADWATEYSDLILSIRIVDSLEAAIDHITTFGSRHTEAIVTQDPQAADAFIAQVDAAGVFHNCSTRFADGFRYGFGAEVGISTQKMPPRGPVGLEGLVTYKYQLVGEGQTADRYSGADAKPFLHRDVD